MKYTIYILTSFFLIGCAQKKSIVETSIDLSNQDSVKTYLNGNWYYLDKGQKKELIEIKHYSSSNSLGIWRVLDEKVIIDWESNKPISLPSCQPFAKLVFKKDTTIIKLTGMGGSDSLQINHLSKNRLILNKKEYLKSENVR